MDVIHPHCAGIDVHKDTVVVCVRHACGGGVARQTRSFKTVTAGLMALAEWFEAEGVGQVVMEATGVYWKPVWRILDGHGFTLNLVNARHVKNLPGRKSDVSDAQWLADLLAHGLIRASFVPDTPTQDLRALLRTRKQFVRERTSHIQRLQKTLEEANIKLDSVISDIIGTSGRAMLEAMIAGEADAARLAALANRRIKADRQALLEALAGKITGHHRFLLKLHLAQIDAIDKAVAELDAEVEARMAPFRAATELLMSIPGVGQLSAKTIAAEIGCDMSRFPSHAHLVSWAGLCPVSDESAGKRRSNRLRKGAPWLKTALIQAAWAATRTKASYLRDHFHRIKARRGAKKAIAAVAASILTSAYHMLATGTFYQEPKPKPPKHPQKKIRALVSQLERLGLAVQLRKTSTDTAAVSF